MYIVLLVYLLLKRLKQANTQKQMITSKNNPIET